MPVCANIKKEDILECSNCGLSIEVIKECSNIDKDCNFKFECCSKPMSLKLKPCTYTETAGHARFDDTFGEPCDDGRAG